VKTRERFLFLLAFCPGSLFPAVSHNRPPGPPMIVVKFSCYQEPVVLAAPMTVDEGLQTALPSMAVGTQRSRRLASFVPELQPGRTARPQTWFRYRVILRNTTETPTLAVTWDYVFTDTTSGAETGRVHFDSAVKIKPGASRRIDGFTLPAPTKVLNASAKVSYNGVGESIEIVRVVFADGKVWDCPEDHGTRIHTLLGLKVRFVGR
jgi:hypothetical protein